MTSPVLWYLNRGTGLVLLAVFTLTVLAGILSAGRGGRIWPRFVTQGVHRGLSLVSTVLLLAHVVTAVTDEFVDIRWWQAAVPFGATYRPFYLSLGTLALDFTVAVGITSLLRRHLSGSAWRAVHVTSYAAWAVAVVHALGIGTDTGDPLGRSIVLACCALVLGGVTARLMAIQRTASST